MVDCRRSADYDLAERLLIRPFRSKINLVFLYGQAVMQPMFLEGENPFRSRPEEAMSLRVPRWSDLSLRLKILGIAGLPVIALVVSTTTFLVMIRSENHAQDAAQQSIAVRQAAGDVETAFQTVNGAIWGDVLGFAPTSGLKEAQAELNARVKRLRELAVGDKRSLTLLADFEAKFAAQIDVSRRYAQEVVRTGRIPKLSPQFLSDAETITSSPQIILHQIADNADASVAARAMEAERARDRVVTVVVASGIAGTLGALALIVFAGTSIVRRIRRLDENARRLAAGESLMPFAHSRDELGMLALELEEAAHLLAQRELDMSRATADAERANMAKSEFLSRMSHELRTPLNSILGFGQILEMSATSGENKEDVQHILRAGRHLLSLIDEILDISGIEAGEVRFSIEPVNLEDVFDEVLALTRPIAEKSSIRVTAKPASAAWVQGDRQRLKQVMLNLVANGIKYNRPEGSVTLGFSTEGDSVRIDVADTGRGLSPDDLNRLFVPFERLGAAELSIEGTGLGLALSKRLVEVMGGRISVRSEIGAGSVFSVILPSADAPREVVDAADSAVGRKIGGSDQPLVLYIEDNLANLRLIERVLANTPVRLISAIKGTLGIELATQHLPDVILLDLHLPDIPGEQVIRRLRGDRRTANIPIIVISADATPDHAVRSMDTAAYLTKPLDVSEFLRVFDSVLTSKSVA